MMVPRTAGFAVASIAIAVAIVLAGVIFVYQALFANPRKTEALDANTKLLLHMDGTNGSNLFIDSSLTPKTMTAVDGAQMSTAQSQFGGASGLFDGTTDAVTTPGSTDFTFDQGDFTVDFWLRRNGAPASCCWGLVSTRALANVTNWSVELTAAGNIMIVRNETAVLTSTAATTNLTWTHVAVVRSGNTLTIYLDGVARGTLSVTGQVWSGNNNTLVVGRKYSDNNSFTMNGHLDEVRVTKGVALWTAGFTPPTSPDGGPSVPSAPGTPTFTTIMSSSMRVNWTAASGATSYKVERCAGVGCSTFTQIASGVSALYIDDSGLTTGQSYTYRIRGTNAQGDGAYSATGTQVTGAVPGTPGTPTFSSVAASTMRVSWSAASGASTYKVERCSGAGCSSFAQVGGGINTLYFDDAGLAPGTSYSYRVRGTNPIGDGAYSGTGTQITTSSGSGSSIGITGWAWSDTIGWIALNCVNGGPTGDDICSSNSFGLNANISTGILSGYAWSDNIGWVSANSSDLTGCPTVPCSATLTTTNLTGWLKALSGGSAQSGGWDGFIALYDTNTGDAFTYGISYGGGIFSGYGWGSTNVGWVDFALARSTYNTCTPSTTYSCSSATVIRRSVQTANCQTTVTDPYLTCVAPQFCSAGSPVCLTPPPTDFASGSLSGRLTARPNLIARNGTSTVYWGVYNVQPNSCTVTTDDGSSVWSGPFSATSTCPTKYNTGCTSQPITRQTTYRLSCLDFDGNNYIETAVVNLLPDFQER